MTSAPVPIRDLAELGADIKNRRLAAGKQAKDFAREIHLSPQHLNNIEAGRMKASMRAYTLIALALGVDVNELLGTGGAS